MLLSENIKNKLIFGLIGFSATSVQIVFLREFFEVFNGNELSLGIVLSTWLFWTAIGSYIFGKLISKKFELNKLIIILQILIAVMAPSTLIAIQLISTFVKSAPGEMLGLLPMIITSLTLISCFGLVLGGMFPAGVLLIKDQKEKIKAIGQVYLIEGIGSAIAGILLSLLFINIFSNLSVCIIISIINCSFAVLLVRTIIQKSFRVTIYILSFIFIAVIIFSFGLIQSKINTFKWQNFNFLAEAQSHFGVYNLIETGSDKTMYLNGTSLFTIPDPAAAEESVHFALLQHPQPKNILLIGGGLNGSLHEILKHPTVEKIDYVENDAKLLQFFEKEFPLLWQELNNNSPVKIHIGDARIFLKQNKEKYDVIILNEPDPQTALINRFYTVEFFQMVNNRINPSGIFSVQSTGSENYINDELADYLRCIHRTLHMVFKNVIVFPGDIIHFFAGMNSQNLTNDYHILIQHMKERNLQAQYIREYYLPFRLSQERMDYINYIIQSKSNNGINTDFHPSAFYFNIVLWSTQFSQHFANFVKWIETVNWKIVLNIIFILFIAFIPYLYKSKFQYQMTGALSVFCLGFTSLSAEILILLIFQILYGYVYQQLAILIAAYMAGLSLGTYLSLRKSSQKISITLKGLFIIHIIIALFIGLIPFLFQSLDSILNPFLHKIFLSVIFIIIILLVGGLGGYQFPLAGLVYHNRSKSNNTGILYSLDLFGAMIGALLLSSFIIPLFGIYNVSFILAGMNIFIALLLVILQFKAKD